MSENLKPCPFCGSIKVGAEFSRIVQSTNGNERQNGIVACQNCHSEGPYVGALNNEIDTLKNDVIIAWNRRSE